MDHFVPKRRVSVTLWSHGLNGLQGQLFLDLDAATRRHQTVHEKLNESGAFVPVAVGDDGRIHLFSKAMLVRVTVGRQVVQSDVYARGFQPWREEEADVLFEDGVVLSGRVWMLLTRESQRLSDFMNQQGTSFFVLTTGTGIHLINSAAVVRIAIAESAGAPLAATPPEPDGTER